MRWTFLEQAVLIEGAKARDSRNVSAEVVRRHWWRTPACTYPIAICGIALGPVGALLVLLGSLALGFINVLSSVFYLVLIPYVGVALTLLYFDLHERPASAE